jgi:hypothetical protein
MTGKKQPQILRLRPPRRTSLRMTKHLCCELLRHTLIYAWRKLARLARAEVLAHQREAEEQALKAI